MMCMASVTGGSPHSNIHLSNLAVQDEDEDEDDGSTTSASGAGGVLQNVQQQLSGVQQKVADVGQVGRSLGVMSCVREVAGQAVSTIHLLRRRRPGRNDLSKSQGVFPFTPVCMLVRTGRDVMCRMCSRRRQPQPAHCSARPGKAWRQHSRS